jgi:hypothetical protein
LKENISSIEDIFRLTSQGIYSILHHSKYPENSHLLTNQYGLLEAAIDVPIQEVDLKKALSYFKGIETDIQNLEWTDKLLTLYFLAGNLKKERTEPPYVKFKKGEKIRIVLPPLSKGKRSLKEWMFWETNVWKEEFIYFQIHTVIFHSREYLKNHFSSNYSFISITLFPLDEWIELIVSTTKKLKSSYEIVAFLLIVKSEIESAKERISNRPEERSHHYILILQDEKVGLGDSNTNAYISWLDTTIKAATSNKLEVDLSRLEVLKFIKRLNNRAPKLPRVISIRNDQAFVNATIACRNETGEKLYPGTSNAVKITTKQARVIIAIVSYLSNRELWNRNTPIKNSTAQIADWLYFLFINAGISYKIETIKDYLSRKENNILLLKESKINFCSPFSIQ